MKLQPGLVFAGLLALGLSTYSCANGDTVSGSVGSGGDNGSGSGGDSGSGSGGSNSSGSGGSNGSGSGGSTSSGFGGSNSSGSGGSNSSGSGGTTTNSGGTTGSGGSKGGSTGSGGVTGSGGLTGSGGATGSGGMAGAGAKGGATGSGGMAGAGGKPTTGSGGAAGSPTTGSGGSPAGGASGSSSAENNFAGCNASAGALLSADNKALPNPFIMHDGTMMTSKSQWECRRAEIMADLGKYEINPKQDPSTVTSVKGTLSGKNLTVAITTASGSMSLTSAISGSGSCVVIALDGASGLVTGCTTVPFTSSQVVQSMQNSNQYQSDPFYKVYPSLWQKIGNYSAWSWGISRLIDGLGQVASQLNIDMTKISVHGCSYAGKMALFGGALDERVALTVVEESGGGGIDSWRLSQEYTDRTGVQVEKIDNTNYAWFMTSMKSLDPYKLPHDHHELIGMIAPRAVIILGNPGYDWLGDESGYKSTMAAVEIFKAMGVADHIGYDFTGGHSHCGPPATQVQSVATFVNRFLKGTSTTSNVAIKPSTGKSFDLTLTSAINWTTPTLQ